MDVGCILKGNLISRPFRVLYQCVDSSLVVIILGKYQGQYLLMLLFLLFAWPLVYAVCSNHKMVGFQPLTGTAPDLGSVALININYFSHLPPDLFQPFLDISPPPPPWYDSHCSPVLHPSTPICYLIEPAFPPQLSQAQSGATIHLEGAPTLRPPPL